MKTLQDNNKCVYEVFEGGMFLFKFVYAYGLEYSCADLKWHTHNIITSATGFLFENGKGSVLFSKRQYSLILSSLIFMFNTYYVVVFCLSFC